MLFNMTHVKSLLAATLLSVFAAASFAETPALGNAPIASVGPVASHHAVERNHRKHHPRHRHHAPVRR